jgi:isocitrate dehydrogenase
MPGKIKMRTPLVEMDGDEMTRIIWKKIKEILIEPYVDLKTEYYDLGLKNRDATDDQITVDAANATRKYGVGVKCATITPNADRVKEYNLKKMWKSPNGTIRAIIDGTVFREPILVKGITPLIPAWEKPITIARHAYGDIYRNVEMRVPAGAKAELVVTKKDGSEERELIHDFDSPGIIQGQHNIDRSIENFAKACFRYALETKQDLWFATKDTISKKYDHRFKDIFNEIYESEYHKKFDDAGITYFYTLIDDAVARVIRSNGGFIWACKNYDGDVMSDMIATAFGSLAMMTSVLVSSDGVYEYEAAHGTVQRHYYKYLKGEKTSTNSMATIFAWTGALKKRGELDNLPELSAFAERLEKASISTIEDGVMTGDLARVSTLPNKRSVDTETFLHEINSRL